MSSPNGLGSLRRRRHAPARPSSRPSASRDGKHAALDERCTGCTAFRSSPTTARPAALTRDGKRLRARDRRDVDADALRRSLDAEPEGAAGLRATGLVGATTRSRRTARPLYLIQVLPATDPLRYLVRAYDLSARRLVDGRDRRQERAGRDDGLPGQPRRRARTGSGRTRSTSARARSRSSTR